MNNSKLDRAIKHLSEAEDVLDFLLCDCPEDTSLWALKSTLSRLTAELRKKRSDG